MFKNKTKIPKKGSAREEMTLALLNKFTNKLRSVPEEEIDETKALEEEPKQNDDDEEDLAGDGWLGHKLTFEAERAILAKDANTKGDDWFDIFDPRNPLNKRRREHDKKPRKWNCWNCVLRHKSGHVTKRGFCSIVTLNFFTAVVNFLS